MNETSDAFRTSGVGIMGSLDYGFGSGMVGLALRASRQRAHFYGDVGRDLGHSLELGLYGGIGIAGGFVQGYAGLGRDKLDTERTGVARDVEATPKGHHTLAGFKAGYLMPLAGMRIGPVAALDWAHAYVKAFAEEGDAALNLGVGSVKAKSLRGSLGVEARGDLDLSGTAFRPYASAALEKEFADGDRTIYFNEQAAPTIVNHWTVDGDSKQLYGRLKGGIAAGIFANVRIDASIEGTVGREGGNETSGNVAARIAF
jgi:outer membrane autotransporter protein